MKLFYRAVLTPFIFPKKQIYFQEKLDFCLSRYILVANNRDSVPESTNSDSDWYHNGPLRGWQVMIPYQVNSHGLLCLLPDGRVEFLHPAAKSEIEAINQGDREEKSVDFDDFILNDILVDLDGFHLAAPAIVFIETTNLCNLRCKHCYAWSGARRPNELSTGAILGLIDQLAEIGVLQVFLTGGEIFAHPDAVEIIQHAKSKPFSTQIFTNGLLITEESLAAIPTGTSFFISFDTADPTRTIRGGMDFPHLRQCFEWMQKYGHVLRTAISVHRNNIHDAEEIFEWCLANGFPRPQWLETHPIGRALLHPDLLLRPDQVDEAFEVYKRCMDRFSLLPMDEEVEGAQDRGSVGVQSVDTIKFCQRLERATGHEKCARSVAYVTSAGDAYPCSNCMSNKMYIGGNIREQPFRDIWENGFDAIRRITFDQYEVCKSCPVHQEDIWCQFRCPPLAQNVSGQPLGCGATDYLKEFILRSGRYWADRRRRNIKLVM